VIIYDKETIKICNQLGSHQMALEKDEQPSRQQRKNKCNLYGEIETLKWKT
jgi:hypothetical protein